MIYLQHVLRSLSHSHIRLQSVLQKQREESANKVKVQRFHFALPVDHHALASGEHQHVHRSQVGATRAVRVGTVHQQQAHAVQVANLDKIYFRLYDQNRKFHFCTFM
jgi:hypothetical protein